VQACKDGQNEKIGAISGILRPFSPETTNSPSNLVPIPRPTGQLAAAADSTHFGFRTIESIRGS
jgi:hypothetical protein